MAGFKKRSQIKRIIITWSLLIILIGTIMLTYFEKQVRPMIKSLVINSGQSFATDAINEAINEILLNGEYDYNDIITINESDAGRIEALTTNYIKLNLLKSNISLLAQNKISQLSDVPITIPMGTLTGFELIKNLGPNITLNTTLTGGVTTEFKSEFTEAGLNQTLHTIEALVKADISVYTTGVNADTSISTNIIIAQTVISGEIPDLFTDIT